MMIPFPGYDIWAGSNRGLKPRLCSSHLLRPEKLCCNACFTILLLNIFTNMPSA